MQWLSLSLSQIHTIHKVRRLHFPFFRFYFSLQDLVPCDTASVRVKSTIPMKRFAFCSLTEAHTPGSLSLSHSLSLSLSLTLSLSLSLSLTLSLSPCTHTISPWLVLPTHTGLISPPEQQWTNKDKWSHTRGLTDWLETEGWGASGVWQRVCTAMTESKHYSFSYSSANQKLSVQTIRAEV